MFSIGLGDVAACPHPLPALSYDKIRKEKTPCCGGPKTKRWGEFNMLVVTTNALKAGTKALPYPSWPGLHVLVVLPGSKCDPRAFEDFDSRFVVVEWLQEPANATVLLCDVIGWLETRLNENEGPLLYIDRPLDTGIKPDDLGQIPPLAVDATFRSDRRINQLVLGDMIATSPLLPDLFRKLNDHAVNDTQFTEVLTDLFVWKDT